MLNLSTRLRSNLRLVVASFRPIYVQFRSGKSQSICKKVSLMTRRVALQKNAVKSMFGVLKSSTRSCGVRLLVVLLSTPDESPDAVRGTTRNGIANVPRPPYGKTIKTSNKRG